MLHNTTLSNFREVNRVTVTPNLCDELGHMNIQHYYATLSDGMFRVMEIVGIPKKDIPTRRTSFALYKEEAEFVDELNSGDAFYMATALEHIGTKSVTFQHRFFSALDGRLLFRTKFISVFMNLNSRTSMPIPEEIKESTLREFPKFVSD